MGSQNYYNKSNREFNLALTRKEILAKVEVIINGTTTALNNLGCFSAEEMETIKGIMDAARARAAGLHDNQIDSFGIMGNAELVGALKMDLPREFRAKIQKANSR